MTIACCSYNIGQDFDHRNTFLRTAEHSLDPETYKKWKEVRTLYDFEIKQYYLTGNTNTVSRYHLKERKRKRALYPSTVFSSAPL